MTISERIKTARKQKGLTQQKLAELIGVQASAISKYEKDLVDVSYSKLIAISQALEVDMSELLPIDKAETKTEDKPAQSIGIDEATQLMNNMHTLRGIVSSFNEVCYEGGYQALELALLTEILATLKDIKKDLTPAGKQGCKGHKPTE